MSKILTTKTASQRKFSEYKSILNEEELNKLDYEIRLFCNGNSFDDISFLKSKGALNEKGEVIINGFEHIPHPTKKDEYVIDCDPIRYQEWTSKLEQWGDWKGRKNYGERKKLISYQEIMEQSTNNFKM